jgi:hypothetical protein
MSNPTSPPDDHLDALFALARTRRPDTSIAEYAFETRLLARLRTMGPAESIWAKVSWRMMPFFAMCVVILALWHAEVASETHEAEQLAYADDPDTVDMWNNLN